MKVNPLSAAIGFALIALDAESVRLPSREAIAEKLDRMCDAHASIVSPDGSVGGIDRTASEFWVNGQAPGRGAVSTATPADPSAIGPHLAPGELPCSGGKDCPDHSRLGNEGGSGHV